MSSAFPIVTPDLNEFMDLRKRDLKSELNCFSIGTIKEFNSTNQTVTIQVNFLRGIKGKIASTIDNPEGIVKLNYPLLVNCPLMFLSGGSSYLTFPIQPGDTCIILFADKDIDTWFSSGQINIPNSDRTHDLNDAIAIVGIRSLLNKISNYNTNNVSLSDQTGERLWISGDTKTSFRTANHSGWLIMDGKSIGNISSGADYEGSQYREVFDVIKYASPNTGSEDFDAGDSVSIPDMRGRNAVGADNMGGTNANVLTPTYNPNRDLLGGFIGEEAHVLTVAELAAHHHEYLKAISTGRYDGSSSSLFNSYETDDTTDTGNDVAHQNVQPGTIMYWFIKI